MVVVELGGVVSFLPAEEIISVDIELALQFSPVLIVLGTALILGLSDVTRFVEVAKAEEIVGVISPLGSGAERQGLSHGHLWRFLLLE